MTYIILLVHGTELVDGQIPKVPGKNSNSPLTFSFI